MLSDRIIYYLANYTLQHSFEKEIAKLIKNEKKLVIFDVGCYRGTFTKSMLNFLSKSKYKFYLFDINKKVKRYISNLIKLKNINYKEIALTDKKGKAIYNFNPFFEAAGSSISNIVRDDKKWNFSRKLILKTLFFKTKNFIKYKVKTTTLDSFVRFNRINSIDVLKIDVEGSEHKLLKGAKNTLKKNKIKVIALEIIEKKDLFASKEKKILKLLSKSNFVLLKKVNILSISFFSNIKGNDYLLINRKYAKS